MKNQAVIIKVYFKSPCIGVSFDDGDAVVTGILSGTFKHLNDEIFENSRKVHEKHTSLLIGKISLKKAPQNLLHVLRSVFCSGNRNNFSYFSGVLMPSTV